MTQDAITVDTPVFPGTGTPAIDAALAAGASHAAAFYANGVHTLVDGFSDTELAAWSGVEEICLVRTLKA